MATGECAIGLGRRKRRQDSLWIATEELPRIGGHVSYERVNRVRGEHGFDPCAEDACPKFYVPVMGRREGSPCGFTTTRSGRTARSDFSVPSSFGWPTKRTVETPVALRPWKTLLVFHSPTATTAWIVPQIPHFRLGPNFGGRSAGSSVTCTRRPRASRNSTRFLSAGSVIVV